MTRSGIVLAGTVILDIVHMVDHWPEQESVSLIDHSEYGAGGPPHNAAAGLVKLQAPFPVRLLGAVGDDPYGDIFVGQADNYGLDTSGIIRIPGEVTSHTHVMTTISSGRRTFFHQVGVNAKLEPAHLLPSHSTARIFYLGAPGVARGLDTSDGWSTILRKARADGFVTALELVPLEASIIRRHVPQLLPLVDILVVNDSEAAAVVGFATTNEYGLDRQAAERACRTMLDLGVGRVVAIHHPDGAVALGKTGEKAQAGSVKVPARDIVGSVGAGDAFYAGMLLGLHEGWPLADCLALANAAAATSLQSATTSSAIRPWKECLAYAATCGLREV